MTKPASLPSHIELLQGLVGLPSISSSDERLDSSNGKVVEVLADYAESLGFECFVQELGAGKVNLIAKLGQGDGGLVLAGHSDTVPYDEGSWRTDPFQLHREGDDLFGLGSADMKGFFASALHAARHFSAEKLTAPLFLVATADEETTMDGARALLPETSGEHVSTLVQAMRQAKYAVIGEPTSLRPVHKHKGILMEMLSLHGQSGHSSNPALGRSALDAMSAVLQALMEYRSDLAERYRDPQFSVPIPTMNFGHIHGGDAPNRICARCDLHFDVRLLPGMEARAIRSEIEERVRAAIDQHRVEFVFERLAKETPAHELSRDSELVREVEALRGAIAESVMFSTESPFFAAMGLQTLVCGPGSIDVAHQPNECTSISQLHAATDLYSSLIQKFCG